MLAHLISSGELVNSKQEGLSIGRLVGGGVLRREMAGEHWPRTVEGRGETPGPQGNGSEISLKCIRNIYLSSAA